jgi:hypothetical protein
MLHNEATKSKDQKHSIVCRFNRQKHDKPKRKAQRFWLPFSYDEFAF